MINMDKVEKAIQALNHLMITIPLPVESEGGAMTRESRRYAEYRSLVREARTYLQEHKEEVAECEE